MSVFGGLPETRAESTISISLKAISAAERTDGLPWVDLGREGGPPSASGACGTPTCVKKCVPLSRKSMVTWQKWQPFSEKRKDEDQSSGVLGRHPDTRAESTISISLEAISAAARTGGLPCVDLGVGE